MWEYWKEQNSLRFELRRTLEICFNFLTPIDVIDRTLISVRSNMKIQQSYNKEDYIQCKLLFDDRWQFTFLQQGSAPFSHWDLGCYPLLSRWDHMLNVTTSLLKTLDVGNLLQVSIREQSSWVRWPPAVLSKLNYSVILLTHSVLSHVNVNISSSFNTRRNAFHSREKLIHIIKYVQVPSLEVLKDWIKPWAT